jgi:hypothetical protein
MKNNPEIGTYVSNQGDKVKDFFETGFGKQPTEVTASIAYAVFKHTARFKAARDLYIDLGSKTMLGEPNSYYFFKLIYSF